MVELARLESVCMGNRTVGSNPTLSARLSQITYGKGARVVDSAGLENRYSASRNRGFESLPFRISIIDTDIDTESCLPQIFCYLTFFFICSIKYYKSLPFT